MKFYARSMLRLSLLATLVVLALPAAASANVHLVGITPTVHRGGYVSLQVLTVVTAVCVLRVHHGAGRLLQGPSVAPQENHLLGALHWRWRMPAHAALGRWSVDLACGDAGTLHTAFTVN